MKYLKKKIIIYTARIVHQYEHLLYYAKSPHSWALPSEWQKICEKFPAIIRNKVTTSTTTTHASTATTSSTTIISNTTTILSSLTNPYYSPSNPKASSLTLRVACNNAAAPSTCIQNMTTASTSTFTTSTNTINNTNIPTCTTTNNSSFMKSFNSNSTTHHNIQTTSTNNFVTNITPSVTNNNNVSNSFNNSNHNNSNNNFALYINDSNNLNTSKPLEAANNTLIYKINSHHGSSLPLNIRRKGFFNRLTYSIDEDGYEATNIKTPSPNVELPPPPQPATCSNVITHITPNANNASLNVTAGSGRIHSAGLNRHITSVRTGPMTSVPFTTLTNTDTRQKLLNKQIKIISDIMVESSKNSGGLTNKSNENLKLNYEQLSQKVFSSTQGDEVAAAGHGDDDDDDEVEIVAVSLGDNVIQTNTAPTSTPSSTSCGRPKLNLEFRSYSTCD